MQKDSVFLYWKDILRKNVEIVTNAVLIPV